MSLETFPTWDTKTSGSRTRAKTPKAEVSDSAESLAADLVSSESTASTSLDEHSEKSHTWLASRSLTNFSRLKKTLYPDAAVSCKINSIR
ncbi:unnamed protein product [Oikopleura dioica]|uniref:Uncharacterized protein n=1 Tax=Oikopleura dioica TaxID=34765 RepID=E4X4M2_OIKDI|nr:unnamed protein product [Oikopleura dioica]